MKKLFVGNDILKFIENETFEIADRGFFYTHDEVPRIKAEYFDLTLHSINLFRRHDYRTREAFIEKIDALFPRGNGTLTKDTGLDFIAECLQQKHTSLHDLIPQPDKKDPPGHIWAYSKIQRILRSPVLEHVFCNAPNFSFDKRHRIFVRLNEAELGSFDKRALAYFLIGQFNGQVIIPRVDLYAPEILMPLIAEDRLIAGVQHLSSLPLPLQTALLSIPDREPHGALHDDAELLAKYAGHRPDPSHTINGNPYDDYIKRAMELSA